MEEVSILWTAFVYLMHEYGNSRVKLENEFSDGKGVKKLFKVKVECAKNTKYLDRLNCICYLSSTNNAKSFYAWS